MSILKSIKNAKLSIYENYSDKEILKSELGSILATFIVILPFIFLIVESVSVFIMREYLMIPLISVAYMTSAILYNVFKISILNCYKKTGFKTYLPVIILNLIISLIFIAIISLIIGLVIIPKFVV